MKTIDFKIKRKLTDEEAAGFEIVKKLQENGFTAYWAGGAVRDLLLDLPIHDIDIATSAKPAEVKDIFPDSYDRGQAFGVVAVRIGDHEFEIATFRKDLGIADHRRPQDVQFAEPEEDALRRDFTINGLFFDPINDKIIDYIGGLDDLREKTIRFIGSPDERIDEDYLRLIRAVRFSIRLDFSLDSVSRQAIEKNFTKITQISSERLRDEMSKILLNKNRVEALTLLSKLGLLKEILPEIDALKNVPQPPEFHTEGDVWIHTLLALKNIGETESEELVWAVLLHDSAKPETIGHRDKEGKTSITFFDHDIQSAKKAQLILERFRFSHHFINKVYWAISQHMRIVHAFTGMSERKQKQLFLNENIDLLLGLTKADLSASIRPNNQADMALYENALELRDKFEKESSEEEKNQIKKFDLIDGNEIISRLKIKAGPKVGQVKSELEKAYLDGRINTKDDALKMLENFK